MKTSYLYHLDASRPGVQSGRPYIPGALERAGCEVQRIFPLEHGFRMRRMFQKLLWHSIGRRYLHDRHPTLLESFARQIKLHRISTS